MNTKFLFTLVASTFLAIGCAASTDEDPISDDADSENVGETEDAVTGKKTCKGYPSVSMGNGSENPKTGHTAGVVWVKGTSCDVGHLLVRSYFAGKNVKGVDSHLWMCTNVPIGTVTCRRGTRTIHFEHGA